MPEHPLYSHTSLDVHLRDWRGEVVSQVGEHKFDNMSGSGRQIFCPEIYYDGELLTKLVVVRALVLCFSSGNLKCVQ